MWTVQWLLKSPWMLSCEDNPGFKKRKVLCHCSSGNPSFFSSSTSVIYFLFFYSLTLSQSIIMMLPTTWGGWMAGRNRLRLKRTRAPSQTPTHANSFPIHTNANICIDALEADTHTHTNTIKEKHTRAKTHSHNKWTETRNCEMSFGLTLDIKKHLDQSVLLYWQY